MLKRQLKFYGSIRRTIVWIAALSLCLNALLPAMAMAVAVDGSESIIICTPNGYKSIRLSEDGRPVPSQEQQDRAFGGHDCTACAGCSHCTVPLAASTPIEASRNPAHHRLQQFETPKTAPQRNHPARGPPHFA
ncbi:MAG: DUF2946 domain-containing protein [Rhodospirillaceae bacterium]|jgi:hypothetical protein|nr:DUF2946 domain-containing protein [Rhodospirillaceae bacterium]